MRLWHLLLRQVSKNDNPENPGSDDSARTKHQINAKYACGFGAYIKLNSPVLFIDLTLFQVLTPVRFGQGHRVGSTASDPPFQYLATDNGYPLLHRSHHILYHLC